MSGVRGISCIINRPLPTLPDFMLMRGLPRVQEQGWWPEEPPCDQRVGTSDLRKRDWKEVTHPWAGI